MPSTIRLAGLVKGFRRVPGLYVQRNTLRGTLVVSFQEEAGVAYDKVHILHLMRLVNRRVAGGYGIDLNIREQTFFESIYTSLGGLQVSVLRTMVGNVCVGAAACYSRAWNTMRITANAPAIYVVHELLHKLGLDHSGQPASLMFWNQGGRPARNLWIHPDEIKTLVEAYQ